MTMKVDWMRECATALVTPFKADGAFDEERMQALVERQIDGGVRLLVPCGTTGESATMTEAEDKSVISLTVEVARGRAKVIAGAGSNSIAAAVELLPAPAMTLARPRATSTSSPITLLPSASVIVALAPVVPQGTSKRTPPSICRSTSACMRSSSKAPSALKGVTKAVAHPRIQSTFMVMISTPYSLNSVRSAMFIAPRQRLWSELL